MRLSTVMGICAYAIVQLIFGFDLWEHGKTVEGAIFVCSAAIMIAIAGIARELQKNARR